MSTLADPNFVREVRRYGRFDVDGCLNCGSCTVVCDLSDGNASFPRRPLQQTLLGLRSSVEGSLDPWLCHDCGDCATSCPRQTEPRESMMTLRRYLAGRYDLTGISSRLFRSRLWELGAFCFMTALVFALVIIYHLYYVDLPAGDFVSTSLGLTHMFPLITYFTYAVFAIPLCVMLANAVHMQRLTMTRHGNIPLRVYVMQAKTFFLHIVSHRNLKRCGDDKHGHRWIKHWLLGISCTTMCVIPLFFLDWFQTDAIYPLSHPQRWIGYCVTVVMLYVPVEILVQRLRRRGAHCTFSEMSDYMFPSTVFLVALTGIAVHLFRYAGWELACHYGYAVHLSLAVSLVMIEMPFGKWSHVLYRPLALYFQSVRDRAEAEATAKSPVPTELVLKGTQVQ